MLSILWKVFLGLGVFFALLSVIYFFRKNIKALIFDIKAIEQSDITKLREDMESRDLFDSLKGEKVKKARKEKKDIVTKLSTGHLKKKRLIDEEGFIKEEEDLTEGFAPINRARIAAEKAEQEAMEHPSDNSEYIDETSYLNQKPANKFYDDSDDKEEYPVGASDEEPSYLASENDEETSYLAGENDEETSFLAGENYEETSYLDGSEESEKTSYLEQSDGSEETSYLSDASDDATSYLGEEEETSFLETEPSEDEGTSFLGDSAAHLEPEQDKTSYLSEDSEETSFLGESEDKTSFLSDDSDKTAYLGEPPEADDKTSFLSVEDEKTSFLKFPEE